MQSFRLLIAAGAVMFAALACTHSSAGDPSAVSHTASARTGVTGGGGCTSTAAVTDDAQRTDITHVEQLALSPGGSRRNALLPLDHVVRGSLDGGPAAAGFWAAIGRHVHADVAHVGQHTSASDCRCD